MQKLNTSRVNRISKISSSATPNIVLYTDEKRAPKSAVDYSQRKNSQPWRLVEPQVRNLYQGAAHRVNIRTHSFLQLPELADSDKFLLVGCKVLCRFWIPKLTVDPTASLKSMAA